MQKVWMYWSVTTHLQVLETISGDTLGILPRNVTRISENPSLVRGKYLYFLMNPLTMPLKLHVIVPLNLIILLRNFIVIMHWQTCDVDQHQIPYFPNTCNLVYFQVSDMYIIIKQKNWYYMYICYITVILLHNCTCILKNSCHAGKRISISNIIDRVYTSIHFKGVSSNNMFFVCF